MLLRSGLDYSYTPPVNKKRKAVEDPEEQRPSTKQKLNHDDCGPALLSRPSSPRQPALPLPPSPQPSASLPSPSGTTPPARPVPKLIRTKTTFELFPSPPSPFPSPSASPASDQQSPPFSVLAPPSESEPMARDMSASSYDTAPLIPSQESATANDGNSDDNSSSQHVSFNEFVIVNIFQDDDPTDIINNKPFFFIPL
ncbi:hypothetical protein [Parasitella parasitica]|uniref:Uncharacterized protein n=1 Tax=Parasitella parasitica TaxID=35722 RepID=A0A0B7N3N8_9FUNG|nr:hypothetical protein [Parasitella parasitica]